MIRNGPLALAFNFLFIAFVLAPLLVVALVAFTSHNYLSLPYDGLSLKWFGEAMHSREFIDSFIISIALAAFAATLAVALTVPAALAIAGHQFRGKILLTSLIHSPLMIPPWCSGFRFCAR